MFYYVPGTMLGLYPQEFAVSSQIIKTTCEKKKMNKIILKTKRGKKQKRKKGGNKK